MAFAMTEQQSSRCYERGFTLIEVLITVSVLAALALASFVMLLHWSGEIQPTRQSIAAFLTVAKSEAAIHADARGVTGSTVGVSFDDARNQTELTLYQGRPFGQGRSGDLQRSRNVAPLMLRGRLRLQSGAVDDAGGDFAIFIGASGRAGFVRGYRVDQGNSIADPGCNDTENIRIRLPVEFGDDTPVIMSCATGEVVNVNDTAT